MDITDRKRYIPHDKTTKKKGKYIFWIGGYIVFLAISLASYFFFEG